MANDSVGARELKARLGTYLRRVKQGRTLVVTDRGEPVAELRPIAQGRDATLARLRAAGAVSGGNAPLRPLRAARMRGPSAASAIVQDRDDRF